MASTNLEISRACWIGAKVNQEGAVMVPAKVREPLGAGDAADYEGAMPWTR